VPATHCRRRFAETRIAHGAGIFGLRRRGPAMRGIQGAKKTEPAGPERPVIVVASSRSRQALAWWIVSLIPDAAIGRVAVGAPNQWSGRS
jgi:hypothetical protein